jgi:hypothetical protein
MSPLLFSLELTRLFSLTAMQDLPKFLDEMIHYPGRLAFRITKSVPGPFIESNNSLLICKFDHEMGGVLKTLTSI